MSNSNTYMRIRDYSDNSIDSSSDKTLNAVANASALLTEDSSKTVTERTLLSLDLIILGSIE